MLEKKLGQVAAMSRAYAAAEKHMESERRHSNELIREMRAIVAEGGRRYGVSSPSPYPATLTLTPP